MLSLAPVVHSSHRAEPRPEIVLRYEQPGDIVSREALLNAAFGPARFAKTSERLREGLEPAASLSFVATEGARVVGTLRLWPVTAGQDRPCLLLGPLAVAADVRNRGLGSDLMHRALRTAKALEHRAVILVGDPDYYNRFGFSAERTGALSMPGPYERERLLACELVSGALRGARGVITSSGMRMSS